MGMINKPYPIKEKFWSNVLILGKDDCWYWKGHIKPNGYGQVSVWNNGKTHKFNAHRIAYELTYGKIKNGVIDHTCHNNDKNCHGGWLCKHRCCCNPLHLRLTTQKINLNSGRKCIGKIYPKKTHCKWGHEFTTENTYFTKNGRMCLECNKRRQRERRIRIKNINNYIQNE